MIIEDNEAVGASKYVVDMHMAWMLFQSWLFWQR